jgi:hypothetical protein
MLIKRVSKFFVFSFLIVVRIENANGGRLSRNSTFTGSLRTNETASKSPKSADYSETSKLALKKSKMDNILRLMNEEIENEPVYENEINTTDDDDAENNLRQQTPIRNGNMSANGGSNGKAIRSGSHSRSSTISPIIQKQQAPATLYDDITENDCIYDENNSYDNKIYLSANCLDNEIINIDDILSNIDNLKETHILSPNDHLAEEDRAIVDVETGEIFNISNLNQQQTLDQPAVTCNDLVDLNNEVRNLILESDEQSPKVIVKRLNPVGGDDARTSVNVLCDSNRCLNSNQCLYCKLKELDTPMSTAKSQQESHDNGDTDHKHHTVDNCVYCRLKENNKQMAAKMRSDKNEMQSKRPASSSALVVTWNANGQQKNNNNNSKNFTDKSSSSDDLLKTNKSNGKQPAMVMAHDRTKSNPGKPDGLQRSKSASNALKLPISSSGTQTSAENTSSSDGSKENLVDGRQKSQKMPQPNLSLNKRKCSVNAEELKRRRSENEKDLYETARGQQAVDFDTQQDDLPSVEATTQTRGNVKTKIKLMELKYSTNMTSQDEQPVTTVDQVSDVDPNKTSKSVKQQTQSLTTSRTNQFEIEKNQAMPNPNIHAVRRQSSPNEVSTTTSLVTTPPPPFNVRHTNQIANNVFIVESPPSNGSMSDMDLLALKQEEKRQTVKQLKSKFESK